MNIKKAVAGGMAVGMLSIGALGFGSGIASADPPWPPGPGFNGPGPGHDGHWRGNDNRWNDRDWWRARPGKWWNDEPPWGYRQPPPAYYPGYLPNPGGPPPPPVNYYGQWANPVYDPGIQTWGIWLFGIFIPLVGFGTI